METGTILQPFTRRRWPALEIADTYLAFFQRRDHLLLPRSPLVVPGTTTHFVIAGMQPLMPYLRGETPSPASRLTGVQTCLRTNDIERVGDNARTNTSFHMLGNWSVGDYGRREAIELALELLEVFGLDRSRLWVTTFGGDEPRGLRPDDAAAEEWRRAGLPDERIVPLGYDDNFWTTGGPGPCGPDTELWVDRGPALGCGEPSCRPGCERCDRFLEIWNLVFIEFEQMPDGRYEPLPLKSVDTGMGLERFAAIAQGAPTVHGTDLFAPARARLAELTPRKSDGADSRLHEQRARHITVDHARAALLLGLAGVEPAHEGAGSVLRRLIRRAAAQGHALGLRGPFLAELAGPLVEAHGALLRPEELPRLAAVEALLTAEERGFARTLAAGLRLLDRVQPDERGVVPGERLFTLHAERGFPPDLAAELLVERGLTVDWPGYERALAAHRTVSRVGKGQS
jgi:alanyl-tRNA synthetase